jgi:DNA-binding response OmpR family regulator
MACILLVEDEAEIRTMLAEVLADAGHEVVEADSGDSAALLLDGPVSFDLLVTDITMPGLLDGIGLGALFRTLHASRPILYITGRPDALRKVPMRPNREAVLLKPYVLLPLAATVRAMLAAAAPEAGLRSCPGPGFPAHGPRALLAVP